MHDAEISLEKGESISIRADHQQRGNYAPVEIFVYVEDDGNVRIGLNILGRPNMDDVGINIADDFTVTAEQKNFIDVKMVASSVNFVIKKPE